MLNKLILFLALLVSCSSATNEDVKSTPKENFKQIVSLGLSDNDAPMCVDEWNNNIECESDEDCCSDEFYCGYDPEASYRIRYCLWSGKK